MKLSASQISGFLKAPTPSVRVFLIFGPDAGLVSERANGLCSKLVADINDPFATTQLTGATANEGTRLFDEMAAPAFGGGRRLVRLQQAIESNATAVAGLLSDLPETNSVLVIEAGDLDKRSKLRASCEKDGPEVCAIPCYVEDAAQRRQAVTAILGEFGLRADNNVLSFLCERLPPDRAALRSEIEKLCLYCREQKEISADDVLAVVTDAGAAELDELLLLAASGDAKRTEVFLEHLWAEQISPVAILRTAQRHFTRLQMARSFFDRGLSAREATDRLQPKVFWKHVAALTQQVQKWNAPKIERVLQRLFEAEAAVKQTGVPDQAVAAQLILKIAAQSV
jgi:DNA polymerase-3 subunit delta